MTSLPLAIIFDFDGLLMDTESTMLASWRYEWQQWGLELELTGFFADHGGDITNQRYDVLSGAVGSTYDRELSHQRRVRYRDQLHRSLDLAPGLRDWLDETARLGIEAAVASSSPRPWVAGHLERVGLLERFTVIATGDEVPRHKPAPDIYELALTRLGIPASDAIAVEDTAHGVTAAQAAGLRCIAIPNPFVDPGRVAHADVVLTSAIDRSLSDVLQH
ncbi:HAD family hydrolase [Nocardioides speluncae]|uniref:HAD family hydrolase n=1 Tax=Nocardioides speluncae TaxID=2670337 RepID=UPI000D699CA2|nr:HAD-IA family hydrolase [Nocardioides speluncae]